MIKRLITVTAVFITVLGTILVAFNMWHELDEFFVISTKTLQYNSGYTWTYYTIDIGQYLKNLQKSINMEQLNDTITPLPQLPTVETNNILDWLKFIANIMLIYITNWIIYIVNMVILMPTKLILYPVNIILAILGINTSNDAMIKLFKTLYSLSIPQIQYF